MRKKGYFFLMSLSHFSCKNNESTKFSDKFLTELGFHSLPIRGHFDSKGYVRQKFYGATQYVSVPKLEDFWEDCVDEKEVFKRNFIRLTLSQMIAFNVIPLAPKNIVNDGLNMIDDSYQNVVLP